MSLLLFESQTFLYRLNDPIGTGLNLFGINEANVEYFMKQALAEEYGKDTIFCFVADHGSTISDSPYISKHYKSFGLNRHHIPLFFYSPFFFF